MLTSMVCQYDHFTTDWYARHAASLPLWRWLADASALPNPTRPHRKAWEWCAVIEALRERGMLEPGRKGCGFAVGTEPLPSLFAAMGVSVTATDQPPTEAAGAWGATGQHAASLDALYYPETVARAAFERHVTFRPADMRDLGLPWDETFDFIWSCCSIEHLGSLEAGLTFVEQSTRLLAPGGWAMHTTEFNVGSNDATLETGGSVIYRRRDIEAFDLRLRRLGCGLSRCVFDAGDHPFDLDYDVPPYGQSDRQHIKLLLDGHVATSMLLIVRRGAGEMPDMEARASDATVDQPPVTEQAGTAADSARAAPLRRSRWNQLMSRLSPRRE